jgi:hypothetical protein
VEGVAGVAAAPVLGVAVEVEPLLDDDEPFEDDDDEAEA